MVSPSSFTYHTDETWRLVPYSCYSLEYLQSRREKAETEIFPLSSVEAPVQYKRSKNYRHLDIMNQHYWGYSDISSILLFHLIPATKYLNLNMKHREQCRLNQIEADPQSVNPKPLQLSYHSARFVQFLCIFSLSLLFSCNRNIIGNSSQLM